MLHNINAAGQPQLAR